MAIRHTRLEPSSEVIENKSIYLLLKRLRNGGAGGNRSVVSGVSQSLSKNLQDIDTQIVIGFYGKLMFPAFSP